MRLRTRLGAALASSAIMVGTLASPALAAPGDIYAINVNDELFRFNPASPGAATLIGEINTPAGEDLVGIDFRPFDGRLYGLTDAGSILVIDTGTAAITPFSTVTGLDQTSVEFGIDFNPVPNALRIISENRQNLRVTGAGLNATVMDGAINPGTPRVTGAGYTNNFLGETSTSTTLYDIDAAADRLTIQEPPNSGTLVNVGPLGIPVPDLLGFDIYTTGTRSAPVNTAYLAIGSVEGPQLYTVNLATGTATLVGPIDPRVGTVADISTQPAAVQPAPVIPEVPVATALPLSALGAFGLLFLVARRRRAAHDG